MDINKKYDFIGSLDDFEVWLKNWKPNKEENKMNKKKPIDILQGKFRHFTGDVELDDGKKENKIIKMKPLIPLIQDEILKEKLGKDIESSVDELGDLSTEIKKLKDKIEPLQKRYGEIVEEIIPVVEGLHTENVLTKKYVFRIIKRGFDRKTVSYREGFLQSLKKVNKSTRLILEKIIKETEKLTYVKPRFSISTMEGVGDTIKKWVNRFKGMVKKVLPSLRHIRDENKKLKRFMVGR